MRKKFLQTMWTMVIVSVVLSPLNIGKTMGMLQEETPINADNTNDRPRTITIEHDTPQGRRTGPMPQNPIPGSDQINQSVRRPLLPPNPQENDTFCGRCCSHVARDYRNCECSARHVVMGVVALVVFGVMYWAAFTNGYQSHYCTSPPVTFMPPNHPFPPPPSI